MFYVIIYTVYTPYCYLFTIEFRLKSFLAIKAGTERACSEPIIKNVGVPPDKCFCCRIAPICHCKAFIFGYLDLFQYYLKRLCREIFYKCFFVN